MGKIIRKARGAKKMRQRELGKEVGVSIVTVRAWEQGRFQPRLRHLLKIVKVLDIARELGFEEDKSLGKIVDLSHDVVFVEDD